MLNYKSKTKINMKTNILTISCLFLLAFTVSSCSTMKVNYSGKKVDNIKEITLLSTMIGKIQQPIFPLIDAAGFNEKTNSIADQIMDMQKKNIDKYREIIAASLKKNFYCEVIFGNSLLEKPAFKELNEKYNFPEALRINNDNYPLIITCQNDINPFKYDNGKVLGYVKSPENYKSTIGEICKNINTDLIAISYSTLTVAGVGAFGIIGSLRLDTYIFLFDKEGDLISDGHTWSTPQNVSGKNIEDYKSQLDNLSLIIDPMMNKVAINFESK
jgi:hypothetical protein